MRAINAAGAILVWLLQILLGVVFVLIGYGKLGDPSWARNFARWGYPDGFYLVIGALEALGGLALLWPRLTTYAAALLGIIMLGASVTHLIHGETARIAPPLMYFVLLALIGFARRRSAIRPEALRRPAPQRV
jgi:uncharacterized membrane protein YphA (DoxX/SURF4 family)